MSGALSTSLVSLLNVITSQGPFIGQPSVVALVVSIPVSIVGMVAQDDLVQGLSLGAVKFAVKNEQESV
jgi:ABC-type glycerol-3-phosphate transport system permease component